ncbi:unnamed protein product [Porites evermanni]|uniref:Uncharacterized protein n=1 Tax=Porites evermanni TaxID=104178 RepID=A0ABN8SLB2_9CNID|nr:unnamed protein product [Porites evermanni]
MAENSASVAKMARLLAINQIVIGFLLFSFGIADRLVPGSFTGYVYSGVWIGIWMCITGALGIPGSGRERTNTRNSFAGVFMGFSITSAVFGGIIILFYSIGISQITSSDPEFYFDDVESYNEYYQGKMAILAIMLMMGIATFGIGIWVAICTCLLKPCCEQQPQVE